MSNTYRLSDGTRLLKSTIDYRIRQAKKQKIDQMLLDQGFIACEECGKNENAGEPIDCSHNKSVDWCQKNQCSELAYDVANIRMLCRLCHRKHDKTY